MKRVMKEFSGDEAGIKKRLNEIITDLNMEQKEFLESTGFPYSTAYRWIKEDTSIRVDFLASVARVYPEYDMNWLITGEGSMKHTKRYDSHVVSEPGERYISETMRMKEKIISLQDDLLKCMREKELMKERLSMSGTAGTSQNAR